ncbi:TPA: hypothetical protein RXK99_004845 [Escherichia coli]|nr:hypothetical protein [Escherichia coli]
MKTILQPGVRIMAVSHKSFFSVRSYRQTKILARQDVDLSCALLSN